MQLSENPIPVASKGVPWNKGKLTGAKPPLRPKHVWSIRTKLQMADRKRDLALFNLAVDSKLRGCDVCALKIEDIAPHGYAVDRATIRQKKTGRPVRFGLTEQTRQALDDYLSMGEPQARRFSFCRAASARQGPLDPTIFASRRQLDKRHWARPVSFRYAFATSNQGHPDLSPYRQSTCCPTAARPHEDREHGSLSWCRGR
jgi:integrase